MVYTPDSQPVFTIPLEEMSAAPEHF
jgi:hypothetical protein